jgi:geranylgeranyl reductase family protein
MNRACDIIIVGGGPAGSTAGYLLSRAGLKVLLLDKSTFPRHKLCGGCITHKTIKLLERVFGETAGDLKKKKVIDFESGHYEIFRKDKLLAKRDSPVPFYFIERYIYDDFLLKKARQAGAEVIEGERCASFDMSNSRVTTSAGRTFEAKVIIGADGFNSIVRRSFTGFDQREWNDDLAAALEIFVNRSGVNRQIDCPTLFFDFIEFGYAWIFPNKDRLIIGICGLNKINRRTITRSFNNFLAAAGFRELENLKSYGYYLPYGNFLFRPARGNVLLTGDAAGLADPLLGEGIYYAQRSAELASQAVCEALKEDRDLKAPGNKIAERYLQLLQENIFPEYIYAMKIRKFIFRYLNRYNYLPLRIIMGLLGTKPLEAVHGIRSYNWLRKRN